MILKVRRNVGVERLMASQLFSTATTSLEVQLSYKDAEIEMLRARVQELEGQVHNQQQSPMAQQAVGSLSLYKDELLSLVSSSRMKGIDVIVCSCQCKV